MKIQIFIVLFIFTVTASAFPPAPHHEVFGIVRDAKGTPLTVTASITLSSNSKDIVTGPISSSIGPEINYSLKIPMDAGITQTLYVPTALRPTMPYTVRVNIGNDVFVPLEVMGGNNTIGEPGGRTRLDLTLGADSDGDGLPDQWEKDLIDFNPNDAIKTLADVSPEGDIDGDGVSNYVEYVAGTYAFTKSETFRLDIIETVGIFARLQFLAIEGRTYTLKVSDDLVTYKDVSFSLSSDGSNPFFVYLAPNVNNEDIYVVLPESIDESDKSPQFYQLHVK